MRFGKRRNGKGNHKTDNCGLSGESFNLASLAEGQEAVIASVPQMPLLPPLGLRPGKKIRVQARGCWGGPIFAEVEQRCIALGRCLAREVQLLPLDQYTAKEGDSPYPLTLPGVTNG